jgi:hypothetical protein
MSQNDESNVICRLPRLDEMSPRQLLELERRVLADVIRDEIEDSTGPERKVAQFQSYLSP